MAWLKGQPRSEATKQKLAAAMQLQWKIPAYSNPHLLCLYGSRTPHEIRRCKSCNAEMYVQTSARTKYCSNKCRYIGQQHPPRQCRDCGRKISLNGRHGVCRKCLYHFLRGQNHPFWKGGNKDEFNRIRESDEYKAWRKSVFIRDGFKCVTCGAGGQIQADHIKQFALFLELRFELSNGRTLCLICHRLSHRGGNSRIKRGRLSVACRRGHKYTTESSYVASDLSRRCRICAKEQTRKYRTTPQYRNWWTAHYKARKLCPKLGV